MTTTVVNNLVFRGFFEKQKLTGPNFIDWYRQLRIVLSAEDKLNYLDLPISAAPVPAVAGQQVPPETLAAHAAWVRKQKEIVVLMLMTMEPDLQWNLENLGAYDMLKELKTLFSKQADYIDNLERLGHPMSQNLAVSLILVSLRKEYDSFVQNYNMHSMGKTVNELHAMLKLHEQTLPKRDAPALHAIRAGKVQKKNKNKKPQLAARGNNKGKGKSKLAYDPKPKIPPPPKKVDPAKDSVCHHCGDTCHWKRNCPLYLSELLKNKKLPQGASTSGIFTIVLFTFPAKSWVYDTGCGTHICNTTQGFRRSRKLKPGALSLYMGNGQRAAVEAIGSYDLCFPSGLFIVLHNCHYAPSITRGVISVSRLYDDGCINRFENDNSISVSKNNLIYFNALPRDGIFEIVLSNSNTNHYRLGHISKKRIEKLQHDGLFNAIDTKSFEKCVSCLSGKMARKPYSHQVERAKDLLGLIHTDEVENQLGKTIKSLRSDRGGEYTSQEFLDHLKEQGIISHHTPPYTPQHNGVSERRNGTLLDMVRSMMSQTTLPKSFWDYALESVARILNMVPAKKVEKTPYEVWYVQAPKLSYLKVWGCEALVKRDTLTKPDKSTRTRHAPDRMCLNIEADEYELGDLNEPTNYKAALLDPESDKWIKAMNQMDLQKKTDMDGAVHTYKARLVAKGFTQTPRINYEETFSPVTEIRAIRILIAIAAFYDYEIWQMDVKTAFLNGYLSEEVYMEQPEGFVDPKFPNRVCKLKRSIYGLKQASRQ
ncbi:retrotransposon protein, putative, ty1-copia subclass [Tanacetum coccineum]